MIERIKATELLTMKLAMHPAVALLGPRQVGKTTLAKSMVVKVSKNVRYFDLESYNTIQLFKEDSETLLENFSDDLVILDEVQVFPEIFSILRSVIDRKRTKGRFLLLGSANPSLVKGVSESLAGRITYIDLNPFSIGEVGFERLSELWIRGGFPDAFLALDDLHFREWVVAYIHSYTERDINIIYGVNLDASITRKLWTMLGYLNGKILNASDLARSIGTSHNTINKYIGYLEGAYMIDILRPWYANVGKRLVKSPKVYISDSGILHGLLNINNHDELVLNPAVGASWEGFVFQQIKMAIPEGIECYFYRTHTGVEADLVLVKQMKPVASIEIKSNNNPVIPRGFYQAIEDLNTTANYVIIKDGPKVKLKGLTIISLKDFIENEIPAII